MPWTTRFGDWIGWFGDWIGYETFFPFALLFCFYFLKNREGVVVCLLIVALGRWLGASKETVASS
jgi:hypothetical protein